VFATLKLLFPIDALGFAEVKDDWFGVHASVENVALRVDSYVHPFRVVIRRWEVQTSFSHFIKDVGVLLIINPKN